MSKKTATENPNSKPQQGTLTAEQKKEIKRLIRDVLFEMGE